MNLTLIIVFVILFILCGGGGYIFWVNVAPHVQTRIKKSLTPIDAQLGPWETTGSCKTLVGKCGAGTITMERKCVKEGSNGGVTCQELGVRQKNEICNVDCLRPQNIVDWGYANDDPGNPSDLLKGWYDVSGLGVPNDYCRWVGENKARFWSCHTDNDRYTGVDPKLITFSTGPANHLVAFDEEEFKKRCPTEAPVFLLATDPDLRKSLANGFFSNCSSKCVYDYRNPNTGWTYNAGKWDRVENMKQHTCGIESPDDFKKAVQMYDMKFDVQHSWDGIPKNP